MHNSNPVPPGNIALEARIRERTDETLRAIAGPLAEDGFGTILIVGLDVDNDTMFDCVSNIHPVTRCIQMLRTAADHLEAGIANRTLRRIKTSR